MKMSSTEAVVMSIPLPKFDGSEEKYQAWVTQFLAYAKLKRFKQALMKGGEQDLPGKEDASIDISNATGMKQQAAVIRNDMAMATLTIALTSEGALGMVYKAQDEDWPSGKAHKVMEALAEEFQPKDRISRVEMRTKLSKIKLSKDDNPRKLFEQLATVENMYNSTSQKIDQDDLIAVVLEKAPKMYASVLTTEQRIQGANLKLSDFSKAMNEQWRISGAGIDEDDDDEEKNGEVALAGFNGNCHICGEYGHRKFECPNKGKVNNNARFRGTCDNCGKHGHKKEQCWDLEVNKDKAPAYWKHRGENGTAAIDDIGIETLL